MRKVLRLLFAMLATGVFSFTCCHSLAIVHADDNMTSSGFKFDVSSLSPTETKYQDGTKLNLKNILSRIGTVLLIVIPMLAVLFIVVGGIMMATAGLGGKDGQFSKGKTIITFNIIALVLSLTSYSIMQLVAWALQIK